MIPRDQALVLLNQHAGVPIESLFLGRLRYPGRGGEGGWMAAVMGAPEYVAVTDSGLLIYQLQQGAEPRELERVTFGELAAFSVITHAENIELLFTFPDHGVSQRKDFQLYCPRAGINQVPIITDQDITLIRTRLPAGIEQPEQRMKSILKTFKPLYWFVAVLLIWLVGISWLLHHLGYNSMKDQCANAVDSTTAWKTPPDSDFYSGSIMLWLASFSPFFRTSAVDARAFFTYQCTLGLLYTRGSVSMPIVGSVSGKGLAVPITIEQSARWDELAKWVKEHHDELNELWRDGKLNFQITAEMNSGSFTTPKKAQQPVTKPTHTP